MDFRWADARALALALALALARKQVAFLQAWLEASEGAAVRLIENHIAWVPLGFSWAYKLKKPVLLPSDFSTLAARRQFWEEKMRLKRRRRLAPGMKPDVVAVCKAGKARPSVVTGRFRAGSRPSGQPCVLGCWSNNAPWHRFGQGASANAACVNATVICICPTCSSGRDGQPHSTRSIQRRDAVAQRRCASGHHARAAGFRQELRLAGCRRSGRCHQRTFRCRAQAPVRAGGSRIVAWPRAEWHL